MNAPPPPPSTCVFALRLQAADPQDPTRIAGRLEHVLSGRCHDFSDGPSLLACLEDELRQAAATAACMNPAKKSDSA